MPPRAARVLAFAAAGVALVWLADINPKVAVTTAAVLGVGVLLWHAEEFQTLAQGWQSVVH